MAIDPMLSAVNVGFAPGRQREECVRAVLAELLAAAVLPTYEIIPPPRNPPAARSNDFTCFKNLARPINRYIVEEITRWQTLAVVGIACLGDSNFALAH